jgi:SNF2 family DNA or RNA helicase
MGGFQDHEVREYRNLDELTQKAGRLSYRVTRAECLDLPPELYQRVPVTLVGPSRRFYDELRRDAIATLDGLPVVTAVNVLAEILRLQQITGGFLGTDDRRTLQVGTEKLDACCDLLKDLLSDARRKVVVFCRFVAEIEALSQRLSELGIATACLFGRTRERGEVVRAFQEGVQPRVLIVQIQTGGLGITLHRADTAIFYSTGWSLADFEQAKARIQRAGQSAERVQYVLIEAQDTIDGTIYAALQQKHDLAEAITSGWRSILEG